MEKGNSKVPVWRSTCIGFFVVVLFTLSLIALGWSAASMPSLAIDPQKPHEMAIAYIFAMLFNGGAFVGAIIFLSKKYMTKVDQIAENTPALIQTLTAIKEAMESNTKSIKEHYGSLEKQGKQIVEINTIHRIRGCDQSVKGREGRG